MKKTKTESPPKVEIPETGELPDGWTLTKLESAGDWSTGGTPLRSKPEYFSGTIPWIKITDLNDGIVISTEKKITELGLQNSNAKILPVGTICVGIYGSIGKLGILGIPAATNQACGNCIANEKVVLPKFLFYYIFCQRKKLLERGRGGTQANINNKILREWPLPLPPLSEQKRIVARLEALLTHVNAARYRLSRVPLIMKKFRQAVLAAACSGRLTEGWREEHQDVESGTQLLERLTESRKKIKKVGKTFEDETFFEKFPELPSTWTWSTIQQIAERVTVGHVGPMINEYRSEGIPFLRCQNVRENYFDARGLVYISPQFHESLKKSALEPGDLVVVRSGNVGVCCIIPESLTEANCSDLVVVKKPFGFVPKFGAYYVNSLAQKWIDLGTVGIALSHFNTKSVATLPIPLPPIAEQREIVRRVGLLFERADAFDQEVAAASRRCERLTQAVLGKAFRGELVTAGMAEFTTI